MSETCLSNGKLAAVIFGSIFGTLLICAVFIVLLWHWFRKHKNDSKIFYVERVEKDAKKDIESVGHDSIDKCEDQPKTITQKSIVLNDKRYSINNSSQLSNNVPKVLPNLGVTITKMARSGFQITSVEKVESRFVPSDLITELSISLDQMNLEDAAKLLELLVPYRIQLEVLRSDSEITPSTVELHKETLHVNEEKTSEIPNQQEINGVEEIPRLPSVSPPTSPLPQSPSNLPIPSSNSNLNKRDSKTSSDEDQQSITQKRHATRIPTPKSARNSNRVDLEAAKEQNESDVFNRMSQTNNFSYSTKRDVLVVSNDETDEFGLTSEQYQTLENNRQRLERERQSLKEMGILS